MKKRRNQRRQFHRDHAKNITSSQFSHLHAQVQHIAQSTNPQQLRQLSTQAEQLESRIESHIEKVVQQKICERLSAVKQEAIGYTDHKTKQLYKQLGNEIPALIDKRIEYRSQQLRTEVSKKFDTISKKFDTMMQNMAMLTAQVAKLNEHVLQQTAKTPSPQSEMKHLSDSNAASRISTSTATPMPTPLPLPPTKPTAQNPPLSRAIQNPNSQGHMTTRSHNLRNSRGTRPKNQQ